MSASLQDLPKLSDVIHRHGLAARKSLGQNFLLDLNLTDKIARCAGNLQGHDVIEVGPGPGGLTRALLNNGARRVIAIERDERCVPALEELSAHADGRLKILVGDALQVAMKSLGSHPVKIVANLPYNVGTVLLTNWLLEEPWPPYYQSMTLMFQKEVAERICAGPGTRAYGRLSVLAGWRCAAEIAFDLPPQAFSPPPKVTSSVVNLVPKPSPLDVSAKQLERVTRAAFGQRRKMIRSSLKSLGGSALLERANISGQRRAEELSIEDFVTIAQCL